MSARGRALGWFIAPAEAKPHRASALAAPDREAHPIGAPSASPGRARALAFAPPLALTARAARPAPAAPPAGESLPGAAMSESAPAAPIGEAHGLAVPLGPAARADTHQVGASSIGSAALEAPVGPRGEAHGFAASLGPAARAGAHDARASSVGSAVLEAPVPSAVRPEAPVGVTRVSSARAVPLGERNGFVAPIGATARAPAVATESAVSLVSAAVLGRPREVEPVAAALALALRRDTRAKVATVVLIGGGPVEGSGGGGAAARRMVARLEAHGLEPRVRGRLVWVGLEPGDPQLLAWIRRLMYVGAPAVLAVAAPRSAEMDEALVEQDLLVLVTGEPDGPLARSACVGLAGVPIVTAPPLTRGPARALACAGLRSSAGLRRLVRAGGGTAMSRAGDVRGQASILLLAGMIGVVIAALITGAVARAVAKEGRAQRAADLAAVAAARVMNANYSRLFEPAVDSWRAEPAPSREGRLSRARADAPRRQGRRGERGAGRRRSRSPTATRSRPSGCGSR